MLPRKASLEECESYTRCSLERGLCVLTDLTLKDVLEAHLFVFTLFYPGNKGGCLALPRVPSCNVEQPFADQNIQVCESKYAFPLYKLMASNIFTRVKHRNSYFVSTCSLPHSPLSSFYFRFLNPLIV